MEANPKSAPLDSVDGGKFFCGLCHSPNFIEDVISQGNAAAARAGALLSKESVEEKAYLAYVIKRLCCGCGLCVTVCPYGARVLNEEEGKAEVIGSLCQPEGALEFRGIAARIQKPGLGFLHEPGGLVSQIPDGSDRKAHV